MKHLLKMRYALVLSLLFLSLPLFAQQNLREGYVITLQGDTLQGVIDYRTADINTKRCVFKQDGADEFKTYLPGEIEGYRFINNGIYYISKEVKVDDYNKELVFAEYVLHGSMNLYQVGSDEMVLENEDGKQAYFSLEKSRNATSNKELRTEMQNVLSILNKSKKATNIIWGQDKNRDNTKRAVKAYVEEACPDGYCEAYEYKSNNTPKEDRVIHPWAKLGNKYTQYKIWTDETFSGSAPQISAGADFHFNRLINGLMLNLGVTYESGKASKDYNTLFLGEPSVKLNGHKIYKLSLNQFDIMVGPGYQFKTGSLKTNIKIGGIYRLLSSNFNYSEAYYAYRGEKYDNSVTTKDYSIKFNTQYSFYAGMGIEYPLKNFSIIGDLQYTYSYNSSLMQVDDDKNTTRIKQNGICLSVGIKY